MSDHPRDIILGVLAVYLLVAFVALDLNPSHWGEMTRGVCAIGAATWIYCSLAFGRLDR